MSFKSIIKICNLIKYTISTEFPTNLATKFTAPKITKQDGRNNDGVDLIVNDSKNFYNIEAIDTISFSYEISGDKITSDTPQFRLAMRNNNCIIYDTKNKDKYQTCVYDTGMYSWKLVTKPY